MTRTHILHGFFVRDPGVDGVEIVEHVVPQEHTVANQRFHYSVLDQYRSARLPSDFRHFCSKAKLIRRAFVGKPGFRYA